ncbi:hypothetical protein Tco_0586187 [Tanacetum coccineum]
MLSSPLPRKLRWKGRSWVFDFNKSVLCPSFIEGLTAKGLRPSHEDPIQARRGFLRAGEEDYRVSDKALETLFVAFGGWVASFNLDFATTGVTLRLLNFAATREVNKALFTLKFTDKAYLATHLS